MHLYSAIPIRFIKASLCFILILILTSCTKDEIQLDKPASVESVDLKINEDMNYIVVLSTEPAIKNERAKEVLENIQNELGIPEQAVGYKYRKVLTGFSATLNPQKVEALKKNPKVKIVAKDIMLEHSFFESGQEDFATWGLDRIDQRQAVLNYVYSYNATGNGVTAYIMDSGINFAHEDFEGRAKLGYDFVVELDPENTDPNQGLGEDCMGHGTHVAATVGGKTYGVAKNIDLVSVRVFGCKGSIPESRVMAAVEWITTNAVKPAVVNMSLGGMVSPNAEPMELAIQNSIASGINYVVSAGNNSTDACTRTPARVLSAITVGASDIDNNMAGFSNYGTCVDIFAPGEFILSASHSGNFETRTMSGTSMSAPHVTGVVGLYLENKPEALPSEVEKEIITNATENAITNVPEGTNLLLYSLWNPTTTTPVSPPDLNFEVLSYKEKRKIRHSLSWNKTAAKEVEIFIDGEYFTTTENDGLYFYISTGKLPDSFQICEVNYDNCSPNVLPYMVEDPLLLPNEEPIANFYFSKNGLEVAFFDSSQDNDGNIESWEWNFGDGTSSNLQNPTHKFTAEGYYFISLTVTDDREGSSTKWAYIFVEELPEPQPVDLELTFETVKRKGSTRVILSWTPSGTSEKIEVYQNNTEMYLFSNSGSVTINLGKGSGTESFKVCIPGSIYCSNEVIVNY